jgi:VIT1/CCC1 family predicted Fe2+/Mn2+ transporter
MSTDIAPIENENDVNFGVEIVKTVAVTAASVVATYATMFAVGYVITKVQNRKAKKATVETTD